MPKQPLSKRRIASLIYVTGSSIAPAGLRGTYALITNGYGEPHINPTTSRAAHYFKYDDAQWDANQMRDKAYLNPDKFPFASLELHEWAKIHAWRKSTTVVKGVKA
jgi:hypothetical protein